MGILSSCEQRATLKNPAGWLEEALKGDVSPAGTRVNQDSTLGLTAWWNGVRVISQTIASLPIDVFERDDRERLPRRNTRQWRILNQRPNPMMTPFVFKELRMVHLLCYGNSYCEIQRDGAGRVVALWPLLPDRTGVELIDGEKWYWTIVNNQKIWLSADLVLHVPGMGYDGLQGWNPVKVHRKALGLTIAANDYGAQFFGQGARVSGVLRHPGRPDEEERKEIKESWNQAHQGLDRAQRTALLWGGMEWQAISMPPDDAQFLETKNGQIDEVARILNINPILLQKTQGVTTWGTAIGQFLTAFSKFTIQPWLERDEDVLNWDMFSGNQRERMFTKYNVNALQRGDPKAQAELLEIKRRNGVINADEWRALDDQDPLPDGQGEVYTIPVNTMDLAQINEQPDDTGGGGFFGQTAREARQLGHGERRSHTEQHRRLRQAHREAIEDGARRALRRETAALERAVKRAEETRDPAKSLNRWIESFYPGHHEAIKQAMGPAIRAFAGAVAAVSAAEVDAEPPTDEELEAFSEGITDGVATREVNSSVGQLREMMTAVAAAELADQVRKRAGEWTETRPGKTAEAETVRVHTGAKRNTWQNAGVTRMVWVASAGACPICLEMDGRVAQITGSFLAEGDQVNPGGDTEPLRTTTTIVAPPLHAACQCDIAPE